MSDDLQLAGKLIVKELGLDDHDNIEGKDFQEIHQALTKIVAQLLNTDLNKLLTALYRIDVNEQSVKKILATEKPDKISSEIALLILNRELQKIESRKKYR